jgi:hypothetical protein
VYVPVGWTLVRGGAVVTRGWRLVRGGAVVTRRWRLVRGGAAESLIKVGFVDRSIPIHVGPGQEPDIEIGIIHDTIVVQITR